MCSSYYIFIMFGVTIQTLIAKQSKYSMLFKFIVSEKKAFAFFFLFNKRRFIILILIHEMQGVLGRHICPRQVIFRLAGAEKPALLAREVIKILK